MIIEYIRYKLKGAVSGARPDPSEEFEAAYTVAATFLDACPHCLHYELARCREEPDRYILRIEWDSLEGHLSGFRHSRGFESFLSAIKPFIGSIEEMLHYERTAIVTGQRSNRCWNVADAG